MSGTPEHTGSAGDVDVVAVNWNSRDLLRRCVRALDDHAGSSVRSIVVVDNGSRDGSAELAPGRHPVEVLRQGRNLGFGRACNLGAGRGRAPFILFLNPDTEVTEGCIGTAVDYLRRDPSASVCGVRLTDAGGAVQRHAVTFPTPLSIYSHDLNNRTFDHGESRDVDHVMGAFYLIRREVFEALGGFDERFFVYLEDLDLSLRVHEAGGRIRYLYEAVCLHQGGGTSAQVPARRLFYSLHSRLLYSAKHFSPGGRLLVWGVILAVEPWLRLGRAALRLSVSEARNTLAAFAMLYASMLSPRARRRLTVGEA